MRSIKNLVALAGMGLVAGAANAGVTATITADNHYALYTGYGPGSISLIGGNELGAAGNPGAYNWSKAETWTFDAGAYIYVAAWSDDAVAQGWLGQFAFDNKSTLLSSSKGWEYMATNLNLGDGDPWPSSGDISGWVALADKQNLWATPYVGGSNGVAPWGNIAGISGNAAWTWGNPDNRADPLNGGASHEEYQIFRIPTGVPSPGGTALALLAGAMIIKRRR